mgnify:CR=1 FL=1
MMIRRIRPGQDGDVRRASSLFGHSLQPDATTKFLASETHHLFIAYEGDEPVGFTTGVEMTHPDKGTEMFPYELEVAEAFRRRGIGAALVTRLEELAKECGCYGMWVLTDGDNTAALRTYQKAGGIRSDDQAMMSWKL